MFQAPSDEFLQHRRSRKQAEFMEIQKLWRSGRKQKSFVCCFCSGMSYCWFMINTIKGIISSSAVWRRCCCETEALIRRSYSWEIIMVSFLLCLDVSGGSESLQISAARTLRSSWEEREDVHIGSVRPSSPCSTLRTAVSTTEEFWTETTSCSINPWSYIRVSLCSSLKRRERRSSCENQAEVSELVSGRRCAATPPWRRQDVRQPPTWSQPANPCSPETALVHTLWAHKHTYSNILNPNFNPLIQVFSLQQRSKESVIKNSNIKAQERKHFLLVWTVYTQGV